MSKTDPSKLKQKTALSPLLVTTLLLLVTATTLVLYQIWFSDYFTKKLTNIELQETDLPIIEALEDSTLYLKNTGDKNMQIQTIKIEKNNCNIIETLEPGIKEINIGSCVDILDNKVEIVIISNLGIKTKYVIIKNKQVFPKGSINNCEQLAQMQNNLSGNYQLTKNLYCQETKNWNNGKGFIPIGDNVNPFIGIFNGNNYTIYNIYINDTDKDTGLFSVLTNAIIKNFHVENGPIIGEKKSVGSIAGYAINSQLSNIKVTGNVIGDRKYVGGVVGYLKNSNLEKSSHSDGLIIGDRKSVGGIVGLQENSNISNSGFE